ncbi:MAG TPA: hypothetical protein EYG80_02640 [Flavobacteriaceae bacterium]|nr:hypothetical protein [Flavobacteriaceae bacterium]
MDTKLTLKLDDSVIIKAKKYAKKHNVSLSRMIENYLQIITSSNNKNIEISPLVKSLTGVVQLDEKEFQKDYTNFLSKKYS